MHLYHPRQVQCPLEPCGFICLSKNKKKSHIKHNARPRRASAKAPLTSSASFIDQTVEHKPWDLALTKSMSWSRATTRRTSAPATCLGPRGGHHTPLACGPGYPELSTYCADIAGRLFMFTFTFTPAAAADVHTSRQCPCTRYPHSTQHAARVQASGAVDAVHVLRPHVGPGPRARGVAARAREEEGPPRRGAVGRPHGHRGGVPGVPRDGRRPRCGRCRRATCCCSAAALCRDPE